MILKYCLLILMLSGSSVHVFAQTKSLDSLKKLIETATTTRKKIDALNILADSFCTHKADTGRVLAILALTLSKKENYHIGMGGAYHNLGLINFRRNNDSALIFFYKAKDEYLKEAPGFEKFAFTLNNLSRTWCEMMHFDSALRYAKLAIDYAKNSKEAHPLKSKWMMFGYGAAANTFLGDSKYDSANIYYMKAVQIAEQLRNNKMLEVYFKGISSIQSQLGNHEKAIEFGKKAITYIENDDRALTIALANMGSIYSKIKDFTNAEIMADSSLKVGRRCNVTNSVGRNYSTLGNSKMEQQNYVAALDYFKTGLQYAHQLHNSKYTISGLQRKIGEAYQALDSFKQAKESYLSALQTAKGDNEYLSGIYYSLSQLAAKEGDVNNAYQHLKQYNIFHDSAYTNEKVKTITELNTKYETEKKDQQLLLFEKDKELQEAISYRQLQQLEKYGAEKKSQQLTILNYQLAAEKKEQLLTIQELDIENNHIKQQEQQMLISNTNNKLEIEKQQKELSLSTIKNQQHWFTLLLSGLFVSGIILLLLFNRYKLVKKLQKQDALLQQRQNISRDLHDELGATLSGISMYSHLTKEQIKHAQTDEVEKSLNIMQQSAGDMVNKLNDIVWFINPDQDTLQKLMQRLEEYAGDMAAIKNMQVKISVPAAFSTQSLPVESRRNIYLFCKEAINNAVKYSEANLLQLSVKENNHLLEIIISDNGKGFDSHTIKRGNGLNNMQRRADELGATFSIQSALRKGCLISLKVKIT